MRLHNLILKTATLYFFLTLPVFSHEPEQKNSLPKNTMEVLALIEAYNANIYLNRYLDPYDFMFNRQPSSISFELFIKKDKKNSLTPHVVILINKKNNKDFSFLKKIIFSLEATYLVPNEIAALAGGSMGLLSGMFFNYHAVKFSTPSKTKIALNSLWGIPLGGCIGSATFAALRYLTLYYSIDYLKETELVISNPFFFKEKIKKLLNSDRKEMLIIVPSNNQGFIKNTKKELIKRFYKKIDLSFFTTETQKESELN